MGVFCPRIVLQMPPRLPNWGLTTSGWAAGTVIDAMMHCECARFSNDFGFFLWPGQYMAVSKGGLVLHYLLFDDACDCRKESTSQSTSLGLSSCLLFLQETVLASWHPKLLAAQFGRNTKWPQKSGGVW